MKPKLLLLHGALGSKKQFKAINELLSDKFEIFDLDFEGHGGLETDEDFSMDLFANNVEVFLEESGTERINIFGYSMGGYVALNLALRNPTLVEKIVTLGTKFDWTEASAAKEVKMLNPEKIEEKIPHFANKLKEEHHPSDWKKLIRKTAKMMLDLGGGKRLEANDFKQINQEIIIGIGSLDKMVTFEESENASNLLPKGNIRLLENFPHPIEKIKPIELAEYIQNSFA